MKTDFSNPNKLALGNALAITLFLALLAAGYTLFFEEKGTLWLYMLIALLLTGIFAFYVFRFTLERFIYEKIRIIYKAIRNTKTVKGSEQPVTLDKPIQNVYEEVIDWGNRKSREVDELKEMAQYRREFLGNVSHELKSPIFNIQGYVLTLLDGGLEDPSINKEYLLQSEKSINRMIAIVEDLESISQLESSELRLNLEKTDLLSLAREAIENLEIKAQKRNNTIVFGENYEKPVFVLVDKERIRQVFINLIDNSIKYGDLEHGKTTVSFFDMDEHLLVEVSDNGNGMEQQDMKRIFERFYRTDKGRSREQGGSGLGLAIVKHIIQAHEQTINVRSTPGVGTTFGFTLKKA